MCARSMTMSVQFYPGAGGHVLGQGGSPQVVPREECGCRMVVRYRFAAHEDLAEAAPLGGKDPMNEALVRFAFAQWQQRVIASLHAQ